MLFGFQDVDARDKRGHDESLRRAVGITGRTSGSLARSGRDHPSDNAGPPRFRRRSRHGFEPMIQRRPRNIWRRKIGPQCRKPDESRVRWLQPASPPGKPLQPISSVTTCLSSPYGSRSTGLRRLSSIEGNRSTQLHPNSPVSPIDNPTIRPRWGRSERSRARDLSLRCHDSAPADTGHPLVRRFQGNAIRARCLTTALINPSRASEWRCPRGSNT
jgi:hypothetical protein